MSIPQKPAGAHVKLMPARNDGGPVWKYAVPACLRLSAGRVDAIRRAASARRDEFVALQKALGSAGDRDGARFAKDEAGDALKEYRAACLILGTLACDPPGDSKCRPEWEWPVELAPWLDRVVRDAEAA